MNFDIIGDIHGHADKLEALLKRLGYTPKHGGWQPPVDRMAVFVGDLIDRGPDQIRTVNIVRAMRDAGHAHIVMGNHELNAIGYVTPSRTKAGGFLRQHSVRNVKQHAEFLRQVGEGSGLHQEFVAWFKTVPVAIDLKSIKVVHAWWHQAHVDHLAEHLKPGVPMDDAFIHQAYDKGSLTWQALEGLTKGLEIDLPEGFSHIDHGGFERREIRVRWWLEDPVSFREVAIVELEQADRLPEHSLPADYPGGVTPQSPVFVGHYWMRGIPAVQTRRVACVDYSAAGGGPLVAYRWNGESELDSRNFVTSEAG